MAHPPVQQTLKDSQARSGLVILLLRDPIQRALSRYWFEGRWALFTKRVEGSEQPFGTVSVS